MVFSSLFQSFDAKSDPSLCAPRLALLRAELKRRKLDGFVVPRADEYQNEYVPPSAARLAWLTGFSGSAGTAVILLDRAAIFVDGRYTLQVRDETDTALIEPQPLADATPEAWLQKTLAAGQRVGYDPWLHTPGQVERLEKAAKVAGAELVAVESNPVDAVWAGRPAPPLGAVSLHPLRYAGEESASKLARIAAALDGCDALVISDPHSAAWALNIRGDDVSHTPLPLCTMIVPRTGKPALYIDGRKLSKSVRDALGNLATVAEPGDLAKDLAAAGASKLRIKLDAATAPAKLAQVVRAAGGTAEAGTDPVALMKACKNSVELSGTRAAHLRDGAAMVAFLAWFDGVAAKGKLTEIDAVKALETFRRATGKLKDVSFPTISAAGPNAASPHYRVSTASNRVISKGLFLIDSGGQYEDGTTDITRTIAVGKPTAEMRDRFTRVLKGHIAISRAVFPKGTTGAQIDAFARQALWQAGLDFDHGTGHGVGSYLSVHEGPQRISKLGTIALAPGMILSNEPGFYKAGEYGIRIETLVVVEERRIKGAERPMLGTSGGVLCARPPVDST